MPRAPRRGTTTETRPARPGVPPAFVEPQLAQLVKVAPDGDAWVHELKFDGYRILARLDGGKATLLSRRGLDWTASFPTVRAAIETLAARNAIVDSEVAVVLPDGRTSFQALQNAFGATAPRGLTCFAFDLLFLDGVDLRGQPLEVRKQRLAALLEASPESIVRYSDHMVGRGSDFFRTACARGLEGIVSKRRDATYQSGRGSGWVKTKCTLRQELVIAGFTDPEGSRTGIGALLLGYYEGRVLKYAGKCGTGFTQKVLVDLRARLSPLEQAACPFAEPPPRAWTGAGVHWAKPHLVAEVEFSEWTDDGRLRHPSFQGLRRDKPAREVVREAPRPIKAR